MKNSMALGGFALVMSLLVGASAVTAEQSQAAAGTATNAVPADLVRALAFDREQWLDAPALADSRTTDAFQLKCSFNSKSMFKLRRAQCRMV